MTTLQIPDQQAAALQARAAAEGLTLEAWLARLAGVEAARGPANQRMSLVEVLSFPRTAGLIGPDLVIEREHTHAEPADL